MLVKVEGVLETHSRLEVHSFTKYLKAHVLSIELFFDQDTVLVSPAVL